MSMFPGRYLKLHVSSQLPHARYLFICTFLCISLCYPHARYYIFPYSWMAFEWITYLSFLCWNHHQSGKSKMKNAWDSSFPASVRALSLFAFQWLVSGVKSLCCKNVIVFESNCPRQKPINKPWLIFFPWNLWNTVATLQHLQHLGPALSSKKWSQPPPPHLNGTSAGAASLRVTAMSGHGLGWLIWWPAWFWGVSLCWLCRQNQINKNIH